MAAPSLGLNEYQKLASRSDRTRNKGNGFDLPVLGLVGEVGSLISEVKKSQRDRAAIVGYKQAVIEELGDTLWYLAIIADHAEIGLATLAGAFFEADLAATLALPLADFFCPETAPRRTVPAVNAGRWRAAILIFWPVRGCVPVRAADLRTSKVPNPVSVSLSPVASVP